MNEFLVSGSLIAARIAPVSALPLLSPAASSLPLRGTITILLTVYLTAVLPVRVPESYFAAVVSEFVFGVFIYTITLTIFSIFESSFSIMDNLSGGMGSSTDPLSRSQSSPLAIMAQVFAVCIFFVSGAHLVFLKAVFLTFNSFPQGSLLNAIRIETMTTLSIKLLSVFFLSSFLIATPAIIISILINVTMGLAGRLNPGLQSYFIAMPLNSLSKLFAAFLVFSTGLILLQRFFSLLISIVSNL